MLTYKFPWIFELAFKIPPLLIWRKKSLKTLVRAIRELSIQPHKILDIGCGAGVLTPVIKKLYPEAEIFGIDNSIDMINFARMRYGNLAEFKVINFLGYEGSYDLIIGFYSFEFFPLFEGIKRIKKLLNPGGMCIIVTTGRAPFSILHRFFVSKLLRTELYLYSPSDFYKFLVEENFSLRTKIISEIEGSYLLSIKSLG
ncbi:class I SAM-dependent methyltransferase [candidate division WOR-3 bacterium]|nr:class I SAM-dependent methyltransferase [candidate division WOR-3 bacterium]